MAADGDETASLSLEATQHGRGPLLELLLALMTSSLMLMEVVQCVLAKNRHRVESLLDDLQEHRTQLQGELDDLIEAQKRETIKSSQRRIKKEMDLIRKDLKGLSLAISQHESCLGRYKAEETTTSEDSLSDHGAGDAEEAEMAITPVANNAPPVSATTQPPDPPPVEEEAPLMEVDEGNDGPPPSSPVSRGEDEMLTGSGMAGVEGKWPILRSHLPKAKRAVMRTPPFRRPLLTSPNTYLQEALPSECLQDTYEEGTRTVALEC